MLILFGWAGSQLSAPGDDFIVRWQVKIFVLFACRVEPPQGVRNFARVDALFAVFYFPDVHVYFDAKRQRRRQGENTVLRHLGLKEKAHAKTNGTRS